MDLIIDIFERFCNGNKCNITSESIICSDVDNGIKLTAYFYLGSQELKDGFIVLRTEDGEKKASANITGCLLDLLDGGSFDNCIEAIDKKLAECEIKLS